jgi:peptidoglycan hydrolase-like protein with peptidoglycan-binding domain
VCSKSGIPNVKDGVYDDGYRPGTAPAKKEPNIKAVQSALNAHGYDCGAADGIIGPKTTAAMVRALSDMWLK